MRLRQKVHHSRPMKVLASLLALALCSPLQGQVRIGLDLEPVTPALSGLLGLPKGIGFEVTGVDEGGASRAIGVRRGDVLVEIDGQLAVNREQLAVLLQMFRPGDRVPISILRSGVRLEKSLTFRRGQTGETKSAIDLNQRVVKASGEEGTAELRKNGDQLHLRICSPAGVEVFEGTVHSADGLATVPEEWRTKVPQMIKVLKTYRIDLPDSGRN